MWKSANIYGFLNLNDYTISGFSISSQFGSINDTLVTDAYILQAIMTLSSLINYKPVIHGILTSSGIVCYNNLTVLGGIYTTKDININNHDILQTMLTLSSLIKSNAASSLLSAYNLTLSGGLYSNSIICYNNLSVFGTIITTKDINLKNYYVLATLLNLSSLVKSGLVASTGFHLTLSGTLTSSNILFYNN